ANPYDIPGINGASLAVMAAGLPFEGPVGAVRLGYIGGQWKVNPSFQELDLATFDIVVAGKRNDRGGVDILMIEGEATDEAWRLIEEGAQAPSEELVAEGLEVAKEAIGEIVDFQNEFLREMGAEPKPFEPKPMYGEDVWHDVDEFTRDRLASALVPGKLDREVAPDALKDELKQTLQERYGEERWAEAA